MIIYKITNILNGKSYIGQTSKTVETRFRRHIKQSKQKLSHRCCYIANAIHKYGPQSFKIEILEQVETIEQANDRECYWISELKTQHPNGYNIQLGGNNRSVTDDYRKLRSQFMKEKCNNDIVFRTNLIDQGKKVWLNQDQVEAARLRAIKQYGITWYLKSPDNILMKIINLEAFCRERGLCATPLRNVLKGKKGYNQYKGWTKPSLLEIKLLENQ